MECLVVFGVAESGTWKNGRGVVLQAYWVVCGSNVGIQKEIHKILTSWEPIFSMKMFCKNLGDDLLPADSQTPTSRES